MSETPSNWNSLITIIRRSN